MKDLAQELPKGELEAIVAALSPNTLVSLPWLFEHWALGHQRPPDGDWTTWVVLGGRGAGKTRAGTEWVRAQVEGGRPGDPGKASRVALVGESLDEAREVMVFGTSGILAASPPDRRPTWQATRRRLLWPNGAVAQIFSASDPESLRGPQFDAAWCDELGKWPKGAEAWDNLQLALRLGERPRTVVTTTPRSTPLLLGLVEAEGTVMTRAPTAANRMNLAPSFLATVMAKYAGSRTARQELDGEFVLDAENALWTWELIEAARRRRAEVPPDRIVVAVDPPVTGGANADACGIIVAGVVQRGSPHEWTAEIIADGSVQGVSPRAWASRAVELFHAHAADRMVAETNQGGDLVKAMLDQLDPSLPFRAVRATRSKGLRAEPVAVLYEQGRVSHRGEFRALEEQMRLMTSAGFRGQGSPDRVDALVWALTELIVAPAADHLKPRLRSL